MSEDERIKNDAKNAYATFVARQSEEEDEGDKGDKGGKGPFHGRVREPAEITPKIKTDNEELRRALAKKAEEVQAKIENGDRSKDLRDAGLRFHDKMERKQEAEVLDKEELMGKYREEFEKIKDRKTQRDIKEISEKLTELKELAGRVRADEQIDDAGRDELLKDINDLRKIGLEKWKDIEAEQAQNQPDKPRLSNNDGPSYS